MAVNNISIKRNIALMLIYRAFVTITPFITTPYIARVLAPDGLGDYGYTQSICAYFGAIAALGTGIYGQREIAYVRDDEYKRTKIFWEVILFRTATTAASIFIYIFFVKTFFPVNLEILFLIQILDLIGGLLDISWFYVGLEKFSKVFTKNAILKGLSIACIFIFVENESDIYIYVIINSVALFVSNIAFWVGIKKYVGIMSFRDFSVGKHYGEIITLFLPSVAAVIYNKVDMTMLGAIGNNSVEVAYYQQTVKITTICSTTISTISGVIAPRLAYVFLNKGKEELNKYFIKGLDALFVLGIPVSFGLFSVAETFIPQFLGDKYLPVVDYLKLMSPLCFVAGLNNYIGAQYLVITKRQNKYTLLILIGTVVNIICNAMLIEPLGGIGAILASILSEITILAIGICWIRKDFIIGDLVKGLPPKLISGVVMCLAIIGFASKGNGSLIDMILEVLLGIAVYSGMLLILRDVLAINICKSFRRGSKCL